MPIITVSKNGQKGEGLSLTLSGDVDVTLRHFSKDDQALAISVPDNQVLSLLGLLSQAEALSPDGSILPGTTASIVSGDVGTLKKLEINPDTTITSEALLMGGAAITFNVDKLVGLNEKWISDYIINP
jgi:hypothetical protein